MIGLDAAQGDSLPAGAQKIDLKTWERTEYFAFYKDLDFPYINIGARIDVTNMLDFARTESLSPYLTLIHTAHETARSNVNFRYRIIDGEPVLLADMGLTYTHMPKDSETFINVIVDHVADLHTFHQAAAAQAQAQRDDLGLTTLAGRPTLIGYSAIPWIDYTHFVRTISRSGIDSNPKMSWGKYSPKGDRTLVTFSVQVHHGLMDGIHLGRFYESLQDRLDSLG